jgi:hypothetical protein
MDSSEKLQMARGVGNETKPPSTDLKAKEDRPFNPMTNSQHSDLVVLAMGWNLVRLLDPNLGSYKSFEPSNNDSDSKN